MMLFTIVTICYNNYAGLKKTVESVLCQKKQEFIEYIIVDGGSNDGTKEYLQNLPESIKWISEKDNGISNAFNKGVRIATGEAILMLNSGDSFIDDCVIERFVADWKRLKVDILSYRVEVSKTVFIPSTDNEKEIYDSCTMPHQGTLVAKHCYDEIGTYSEEYKIRMDYHFFARCRSKNYSFAYIPQSIVLYEAGGTSMALKNRVRFWKEGMSVKLLYNLRITFKDVVKYLLYLYKK